MPTLEIVDLHEGNVDNFAKSMPASGKAFVAFLADWCGHCQAFKPEWERIKSHLRANPVGEGQIVTASDKTMQRLPCRQPSGFPTLSLYDGDKWVTDYSDGRNLEDIVTFIGQNMPAKKSKAKKSSKKKKKKKKKEGGGRRKWRKTRIRRRRKSRRRKRRRTRRRR